MIFAFLLQFTFIIRSCNIDIILSNLRYDILCGNLILSKYLIIYIYLSNFHFLIDCISCNPCLYLFLTFNKCFIFNVIYYDLVFFAFYFYKCIWRCILNHMDNKSNLFWGQLFQIIRKLNFVIVTHLILRFLLEYISSSIFLFRYKLW